MIISERTSVSLKNVLLAVDFSAKSMISFPFAASIAQHFEGKVFLAHVTEDSPTGPQVRSTVEKMFAAAEEGAIAAVPDLSTTPHEAISDYGSVCPTLLAVASKYSIDLIVIGTHGTRGIKKLLRGSKSQEIVSLSTKPVLVVGPRVSTKPQFTNIVYVTDFSPAAIHALPIADALRDSYGSSLTVLHINDGETDETAADARPRMSKFLEDARAAGYEELAEHGKVVVEFGPFADRIVEVANNCRSDLIVMGLHGTKGLSARLAAHFPGSMAFDVISRARCPVLTICCSNSK